MIVYKSPIKFNFPREFTLDSPDTNVVLYEYTQKDYNDLQIQINLCANEPNEANWKILYELLSQGLWKLLTIKQNLVIGELTFQQIKTNANLSIFCLKSFEIVLKHFGIGKDISLMFIESLVRIFPNIMQSICLIETTFSLLSLLVPFSEESILFSIYHFFISFTPKASLISLFPFSSMISLFSCIFKFINNINEQQFIEYLHLSESFLFGNSWTNQYEVIYCYLTILQKQPNAIPILNESQLILRYASTLSPQFFSIWPHLCKITSFLICDDFIAQQYIESGYFNKLLVLLKNKDLMIPIYNLLTKLFDVSQPVSDFIIENYDRSEFDENIFSDKSFQQKKAISYFIFAYLRHSPPPLILEIGSSFVAGYFELLDSSDLDLMSVSIDSLIFLSNHNVPISSDYLEDIIDIECPEIDEKLTMLKDILAKNNDPTF